MYFGMYVCFFSFKVAEFLNSPRNTKIIDRVDMYKTDPSNGW